MTHLKLSEAKAHLGRYVREASAGKTFVLTDRNKPVATLRGVPRQDGIRPKFGLMRGQAKIPEDFDAPFPEFEKDFYGS